MALEIYRSDRGSPEAKQLAEELKVMRELPARRMESAKRERVKVDSGSLIHVDRNAYSVNSRLIGEKVETRLYLDHIEVWYGQQKVEALPRLLGRGKHRVDYRHIIEWLVRKPGAFENYRYKEDLFPTSRFRMAYDALHRAHVVEAPALEQCLHVHQLLGEIVEIPVILRAPIDGKPGVDRRLVAAERPAPRVPGRHPAGHARSVQPAGPRHAAHRRRRTAGSRTESRIEGGAQ